jgi:adenine-specific DNA-methyltransferase
VEKLDLQSLDLTARNIEALAELLPTVVTETRDADGTVRRGIDFDLLRQELSDHVVEGPQERYRLDWPGKRKALLAANAPIRKTLRPVREESVDFDTTKNLFIEGDNLEALKLLQESYLGKVKLIYIDPPYNTGNDFIYNDDFAETTAEYLARSGQVNESGSRLVANTESNGRFHSDWLSMMYPRLKLARNLLRDDGIIFVSIDDNEAANLRRIMDEVFGAGNFFAELVVVRAEGGGLAKRVVKGHDYLIGYSRNDAEFPGMYRAKDVRGQVIARGGRDYWIETDWLRIEFGKYGTLHYEDIESVKGSAKKREIDEGLSSGVYRLIPRDSGHIVGRLRALDEDGTKFYSVIKHLNKTAKESLVPLNMEGLFDNPKPLSLVLDLVMGATRFSRSSGDIVLDFFAGSGTTAQATWEANALDGGNRRFIAIQVDEPTPPGSQSARASFPTVSALSRERLRRAAVDVQGRSGDGPADTGLRVLQVNSSAAADVAHTPGDTSQDQLSMLIDSVVEGRTGEDLLFHVLLDWGLELSLPIARETVEGTELFVVDDGLLIGCFVETLTRDVVAAIAQRQPERAVFRDSAFATDADRINAQQIFAQLAPHTELRTV